MTRGPAPSTEIETPATPSPSIRALSLGETTSTTGASGFPLRWFGLFSLPRLSGYDPAAKHLAHELHESLFYVLAAIVFVHAAAALYHHYLRRDAALTRMLPPAPARDETSGD